MKWINMLMALVVFQFTAVQLRADIKLPAFFADNMVLQQKANAN